MEQTNHLLFAMIDSEYIYFLAKVTRSYERMILRTVCFQSHLFTIIHLFIYLFNIKLLSACNMTDKMLKDNITWEQTYVANLRKNTAP